MPLLKRSTSSASVLTTASVYTARRGKYQKALGIVNVVIMVSSLIMALLGFIFARVYMMDKIYTSGGKSELAPTNGLEELWSYGWLPWLLIGIGLGTFILSSLGFLFSGMESKPPLFVYSFLMALLVLFQLFVIYVTFNASSKISTQEDQIKSLLTRAGNTRLYFKDETFRGNWNKIQRNLRCCGFEDFKDWENLQVEQLNITEGRCYPESCCVEAQANSEQCKPRCGSNQGSQCEEENRNHIANCRLSSINDYLQLMKIINVRGCATVLEELYSNTLPNIFFFIEINGALTILVEVIAIALSSAFVAQITRRSKRYNLGMDDMELK